MHVSQLRLQLKLEVLLCMSAQKDLTSGADQDRTHCAQQQAAPVLKSGGHGRPDQVPEDGKHLLVEVAARFAVGCNYGTACKVPGHLIKPMCWYSARLVYYRLRIWPN